MCSRYTYTKNEAKLRLRDKIIHVIPAFIQFRRGKPRFNASLPWFPPSFDSRRRYTLTRQVGATRRIVMPALRVNNPDTRSIIGQAP
jgi:hypothetical protein